jgi:hypothetical protein
MPTANEGNEEQFVKFKKRGWINVGAARMCILDIAGAFYHIRKSYGSLFGPVEKTIMYRAGESGASRFVEKTLKTGVIPMSAEGFTLCVEAYVQCGFGNFTVEELDFNNATACVSGKYAFEAWAWLQHNDRPETGVCDYTRGTFLAYMEVLTQRDDLACVETTCQAQGANACIFRVAPKSILTQLGFLV